MTVNPLIELTRLGQSIWYDNIERRLITSGLLKRLIDSGAVIDKFEMMEPSLNDIFITKVTEPA